MEPALAALLTQSVTVAAPATKSLYGATTFEAAVTVAARVSPGDRLVQDMEGKDVPVVAMVHMDGDVSITHGHQLVLPSGEIPVIVRVDKLTDVDGSVYATRVVCG